MNDDARKPPEPQVADESELEAEAQRTSDARVAARIAEVRKKAERMARARRNPQTLWHHLAHMGTLGWLFILPAVGFAAVGRYLSVHFGMRYLAILFVLAGIAVGSYLVFRNIQKSLEEAERDDP